MSDLDPSNKGQPKMKDSTKKAIKTQFKAPELKVNWIRELIFLVPILIFCYQWLFSEPGDASVMSGVWTGIAIAALTLWAAHVLKGLLIPDFSLVDLYNTAKSDPLASAITICAIFYLLGKIMDLVGTFN